MCICLQVEDFLTASMTRPLRLRPDQSDDDDDTSDGDEGDDDEGVTANLEAIDEGQVVCRVC